MISKNDLERLLERQAGDNPVASLYLDMSVGSDNHRTHRIFLNQKRGEFDELSSDRRNHHREEIGRFFARVDDWLENEYSEENRGVVIFAEVGGDWFEALQFPVAVANRFLVGDRPLLTPLAQVVNEYHHHGVVLLDREHARILSVYLGTLLDELEVRGEPYPTAHDVQAGGFSQQRFQRRKLEETKHFFRDFAEEVERFDRRFQPADLVVLGTEENVANFVEFLPDHLRRKVTFQGTMDVDEKASAVVRRVEEMLKGERERSARGLVSELHDRVANDYLATAGYQGTLAALQEGRVEQLVMARDDQREGLRCESCKFPFVQAVEKCVYCGSDRLQPIDATEEVVRMAEGQGAHIEFVEAGTMRDLSGVGALLRF
jgi:peptide subunit release factor 1 (eRF1)